MAIYQRFKVEESGAGNSPVPLRVTRQQHDLESLRRLFENADDSGEARHIGVNKHVIEHQELACLVKSNIGQRQTYGKVDLLALTTGKLVERYGSFAHRISTKSVRQ